ncbi:hypothetical protein [uncultured Veillonella sp.]|uniref:hypothetical protein n=1 Tax=uncultured Veillonella sp. TaxID=159268 RepID=UPI0025EAF2CC|nr:hypothetical protein [uncultured Veillonella sp.]
MRIHSMLFEKGIGNTISLLSCALTIVHIDDVFIPKIKYDFDSFIIKYKIGNVNIGHRVSLIEFQHSSVPLEEFVYRIKHHVLTEYFRIYENRNKLMWDVVQDEIKQDAISDILKACMKSEGDTHE